MRQAILLGLRLVRGGTGSARLRSTMVALAAAIGTWLLLCVAAVARAEEFQNPGLYSSSDMQRLLLAVVCAVTLPVLVLAATVGRLSAGLRDQRLANLRLLGLTPARTRLVAVTEAAAAAASGAVLGLLAFVVSRPALSQIGVAGRHWTTGSLRPHPLDFVLVVVVVPLVVVALAALPRRLNMTSAMGMARKADAKRPSWLRVVPLGVGVALCLYVISQHGANSTTGVVTVSMLGGILLLGIGVILVVPIFVRLLADLMLRLGRGPVTTIAARRLQAQPASVTRVIAGLVIGLFVVTGARSVVGAFESTPQYVDADRQVSVEQAAMLDTTPSRAASVVRRAEGVQGVRRVVAFSILVSGCTRTSRQCLQAMVGSCADLHVVAPALSGCRADEPLWLDRANGVFGSTPTRGSIRWELSTDRPGQASVTLPVPSAYIHGDIASSNPLSGIAVFLHRSLPGLAAVSPQAPVQVLVTADPGRDLSVKLNAAHVASYSYADFADYDFVARLRAMVWAIAAVILSVGLLAFAVAAIDRAISRRREVVSLQLVGVSPGLLRRTQWIESALPIGAGAVLAIGFGFLAGATYLSIGDGLRFSPWRQSLTLAAVAAVSACVIAGLTVLAASPRIRPDLIRTE